MRYVPVKRVSNDSMRHTRITAVSCGSRGLNRTEMRLGIWSKIGIPSKTPKFAI